MNHQPEHTQTGNHQPDNTPETPPHNYPAGANYIRWNYQAIWEDATRCFDIIENEDGVHVFER